MGRGRYIPGRGMEAKARGEEGLQALRSGVEGKAGDEARKVSKH